MKHINLLILLFLLSFYSIAQEQQRKEFDLSEAKNNRFESIPLGSEGVMVFYQPKGRSKPFNIVKLGPDFKEKKRVVLNLPKGYNYQSMCQDAENVYLLYTPSTEFKKYTIFKFSKETFKYTSYEGSFVKSMINEYFQVMNGTVYLGNYAGPSSSQRTFVACISMPLCFIPYLFYNPKIFPYVAAIDMTKKVPVKKDFIIENEKGFFSSFIDMSVDDSLNVVDLLFYSEGKKTAKTTVRQIKNQKLDKQYTFKLGGSKEIESGEVFNMDENTKIVVGLFKNKESKKSRKEGKKASPGGVFISRMTQGKQDYAKMVPFSSFKNFKLSLVSDSKLKDMSDRKKKRAEKSDLALQGIINFSFHNLLIREDEIIVFAEPYFPSYHYETRVVYDAQGRASTQSVQVFDGYRFMGAMVMAFDMEGNMKWENGFRIENGPLSFSKDHKFDFFEMEDGGIKVLYGTRNSVFSKIIYNDKVESEKEVLKITSKATDKKVTTYETNAYDMNGIDYWYDNYYLAYGIQKIKSTVKDEKNKKVRSVFYLNRIEIEE